MKTRTAILFVCMGNICRSPTAEGVFRARAAAAGLDLEIDSAGTHAYHIGNAPDARSMRHAAARGYDLSTQRARKFAEQDFERFDYVLAMDHDNLDILQRACPPQHRHKVKLFMEFATRSGSDIVPDPYYGGTNGFDQVLDYVEDAADGLLAALRKT
ncbi:MAG: low molecular weight phosphotyrosine protein phosphatase [Pseudoduganella sp.]|jgi:protein-tyrosine phosphatase|nr:low molecular weight phosphotyrosine protein phosphatase [Pseudoduganella sp.]